MKTYCVTCLEPQFETPSGICCKNGHGGTLGIDREEMLYCKYFMEHKLTVLVETDKQLTQMHNEVLKRS